MSAEVEEKPGTLGRWLARRLRLACFACVALFLWGIAQFYSPTTGFSSLISIGDALAGREVAALRQVPHHVYEGVPGYDGAYYVQLALYPTLRNPELKTAIDNLPYRARRILFSWVAWALGLGQPAWIVQAHALLNVVVWLALAVLLMRWFPPTDLENFLRWFGILFSSGLCMSVRNSLVDGPSLLLIAGAMAWLEKGKRGAGLAALALAGLGRETSLLAVTATTDESLRAPRTWLRWIGAAVAVALPLVLWMGYVLWQFGATEDKGLGNFGVPLGGFAQKWGESFAEIAAHPFSPTAVTTLATVVALTVQFLFFALRWRPGEAWWRLGVAYAALMVFLATPVWEGFPGAASRVLLPMLLAFNIAVPRGRRWLAVLVAGNLSVLAAYKEFTPPREFFSVRGAPEAVAALRIERTGAWHGIETTATASWRWSKGEAGLKLHNASGRPLVVAIRGEVVSAQDERRVRVFAGSAMVWSDTIVPRPTEMQFGCVLPPGETELVFKTDLPAHVVGADDRLLAFRVANLEIVVRPAPAKSP
ncbi:MAG: hypothetical protein HZA93_00900 [Verrucomicrobia bacterium]|nr:hypothetical protein [Verrucomicrobiota bacterium]